MNTPSNGPGGPSRDTGPQSRTGTGSGSGSGSGGSGEELKQEARHLADHAKQEGKARAEHAREAAADNLDKLADSARAAASELDDEDGGQLSHYVADAAERMSTLAGSLRDKSVDELMRDVSRFARQQPAMFLGGSLAIGFGLARFARASTSRPDADSPRQEPGRSASATPTGDTRRATSDPTGRHWPAGSAFSRTGGTAGPARQQPGAPGMPTGGEPTSPKHGGAL